jgi:diaminohydroxyphosphoribosylaminopyrimidine deaminase/5-amino-6-(5-phosphoribosylamino)uracil reductase
LAVTTGVLAAEAAELNAGFLARITRGRPWLTLKLATSLDGRIATATGESQWITGAEARRAVHLMRAQSDAVLVGAGTARRDDPRLDVRGLGIADRHPVRVVLSGGLALPRDGHLGRTVRETPLWLCHHAEAEPARRTAWTEAGAELIEVPFDAEGDLDLDAMLAALGARGLTRVLCEGGGRLSGALIDADLVDEIVTFGAGLALGDGGVAAVGPMDIERLAAAPRFRLASLRAIGGDVESRWLRR